MTELQKKPATRNHLVRKAQAIVDLGKKILAPGWRFVVVVTDDSGAYVGVSSNTDPHDTEACLRAALYGAHREAHSCDGSKVSAERTKPRKQ